jgi:hypothetical protein
MYEEATMTIEDAILRQRLAGSAWTFDPDQAPVPLDGPTGVSPNSSAARIAAQVHEDQEAAATEHSELLDRLQNQRKRREAERRRTRGRSTAEILAARRLGTG